jgi:hypothetical protein
MQGLLKWLRGFGGAGAALANAIAFLTANWAVVVTTVVSLWVAASEWATKFVQKESTHVFVFVFLAVLWTWIGILFLRDRRKPRETTPAQDYRFGLTFEGVVPLYTPNSDPALGFILQLRNFSSGPIRYDVKNMDIRIGTRAMPKFTIGTLSAYMARGAGRTSTPEPFKKADIAEFIGKGLVKGTLECSITYGHPEKPPARKLDLSVDLFLEFRADGNLGFNGNITSEQDVALENG